VTFCHFFTFFLHFEKNDESSSLWVSNESWVTWLETGRAGTGRDGLVRDGSGGDGPGGDGSGSDGSGGDGWVVMGQAAKG
jgi:hypothetical protein